MTRKGYDQQAIAPLSKCFSLAGKWLQLKMVAPNITRPPTQGYEIHIFMLKIIDLDAMED